MTVDVSAILLCFLMSQFIFSKQVLVILAEDFSYFSSVPPDEARDYPARLHR
jgi:hypothetical protein